MNDGDSLALGCPEMMRSGVTPMWSAAASLRHTHGVWMRGKFPFSARMPDEWWWRVGAGESERDDYVTMGGLRNANHAC